MRARSGCYADIPNILLLQEKYLYRNLSEAERAEGFVTTPFTTEQLHAAVDIDGLFVVESAQAQLLGYCLGASWAYWRQWPMFEYMIGLIPGLSFKGQTLSAEDTFQYGPVCIDGPARGSGAFPMLFEEMRRSLAPQWATSLTFINQINEKSRAAHVGKIGWEIIDEFGFNNNRYWYLAYDMRKPVALR